VLRRFDRFLLVDLTPKTGFLFYLFLRVPIPDDKNFKISLIPSTFVYELKKVYHFLIRQRDSTAHLKTAVTRTSFCYRRLIVKKASLNFSTRSPHKIVHLR